MDLPGGSNPGRTDFPLYILAGGQSRRYGSDKARALYDGEPLICGVARVLEPVASSVTVVAARPGQYDDLGFRTIGDLVYNQGPLGGLLTALDDRAGDGWIILSACDWSGIRGSWIHDLARGRRPDSQAVVFRHVRYEPLLALYHTSLRKTARVMVEDGRIEMKGFLDSVRTSFLPVPQGWEGAVNINRPPGGGGG